MSVQPDSSLAAGSASGSASGGAAGTPRSVLDSDMLFPGGGRQGGPHDGPGGVGRPQWRRWFAPGPSLPLLLLLLLLLLLYVPTFYDLLRGLWSTEEQAHGPMILAIGLWLLYRNRHAMYSAPAPVRSGWLGWPILVLSMSLYCLGRSQHIALFEAGSLIGALAALILLVHGPRALAAQWFPLFFMLFMLPLPGSLVDMLTLPMKTAVSWVVDRVLYAAGYPISRTGVILQIGQYQLLVADACAGLHTLFTLEALGLLYLNIVRHTSVFRNVALAILIVPISFLANVIRVIVLTLVTYHLGDAAGQGFLHGFAGMVLFVSALLLIIGTDSLLRFRKGTTPRPLVQQGTSAPAAMQHVPAEPAPALAKGAAARSLAAGLLMAAAFGATLALQPRKLLADTLTPIDLNASVPTAFGDWRLDPHSVAMVPSSVQQEKIAAIYSQTVGRTYVNTRGERVMLAIAYGSRQTQQMRAHRQEVCYTAQGFQVASLHQASLHLAGTHVPATRMVAINGARTEPVTYWFTMGSTVVRSYLDRQLVQLRYAVSDTIPDGYLVRVSTIGADAQAAFAVQAAFAEALMHSLDAPVRQRLLGSPDGAGERP